MVSQRSGWLKDLSMEPVINKNHLVYIDFIERIRAKLRLFPFSLISIQLKPLFRPFQPEINSSFEKKKYIPVMS